MAKKKTEYVEMINDEDVPVLCGKDQVKEYEAQGFKVADVQPTPEDIAKAGGK